ncbi:MAG TPA: SRPBCC domain-containing protein [Egibacteraceae bacterium]
MDDRHGTRAIRVEVEVPGTPEQVWEAIATGPGISTWFVPAEVAEREGGEIVLHDLAPGLDDSGRITVWDPPRRLVYESSGEEGQRLAHEWLVEARSGSTCVVRLVNSGFGAGDEWDETIASMEEGWRLFLDNLRLVLTHFPGRRARHVIVGGVSRRPAAEEWPALRASLGLPATAVGQRVATSGADAPPLAGVVERETPTMLTLRLGEPTEGIGFLAAEEFGGQTMTSVYLYLLGDDADEVAARELPRWQAWTTAQGLTVPAVRDG